jgi:Sodium Bile acid symporter family
VVVCVSCCIVTSLNTVQTQSLPHSSVQMSICLPVQVISRQYLSGDELSISFWEVARSVLLFLGIPLVLGIVTRYAVTIIFGKDFLEKKFLPFFGPVALVALIYTIIVMFSLQVWVWLLPAAPVFLRCQSAGCLFIGVWEKGTVDGVGGPGRTYGQTDRRTGGRAVRGHDAVGAQRVDRQGHGALSVPVRYEEKCSTLDSTVLVEAIFWQRLCPSSL